MFQSIRIFLDNNKEMQNLDKFRVFCHTDARNNRGYDLKLLAKRTGIGKYIIFQDPYMSLIGLPDKLMNRIYNSFDVLMNLSRREGFCLSYTIEITLYNTVNTILYRNLKWVGKE